MIKVSADGHRRNVMALHQLTYLHAAVLQQVFHDLLAALAGIAHAGTRKVERQSASLTFRKSLRVARALRGRAAPVMARLLAKKRH